MARKKGDLNRNNINFRCINFKNGVDCPCLYCLDRGNPFRVSQSPKTAIYSVDLQVNNRNHTSTGDTLEEALNNIKIEPTRGVVKIYTKGILKVKKGEKEIERLLFIRQMSRLFGEASKLGKECAMVQATRLISALLNDNR